MEALELNSYLSSEDTILLERSMWTTPDDLRKLLKISPEELPDAEAVYYIEKAQNIVRADTGVDILLIKLEGSIDGVNRIYRAPVVPIGDKNFDLVVDHNDVDVYGFLEEENEASKEALEVESVSPNTGLIVLKNAPLGYVDIRASYVNSWIIENPEGIRTATALMAGYLYACEFNLLPIDYSLGTMKISYAGRGRGIQPMYGLPTRRLWYEYQRVISPFRTKLIASVERDRMELEEREP